MFCWNLSVIHNTAQCQNISVTGNTAQCQNLEDHSLDSQYQETLETCVKLWLYIFHQSAVTFSYIQVFLVFSLVNTVKENSV